MIYNLLYCLAVPIVGVSMYGISQGGLGSWLGFFILFGLIPVLELSFPNWKRQDRNLALSAWTNLWLYASPFYLSALLIFSGVFFFEHSGWERLGIVLTTGSLLGAFGITYAHELVHRAEAWERALGVWNLMLVNFAHWGIEHVFGHHRTVGTPEDGATARKDQTLYHFWVQNYFQGLVHAWHFETTRLKNAKTPLYYHRIALYWVVSALATLAIGFSFGALALLYWWSVAAVATVLLLTVDYIEHYGLTRVKKENGLYEPVKPQHSWDSASWPTNAVLANLGLHSHHHMKARVPFHQLEPQTGAQTMPFGYSVMVVAALIPPLYFRIMNPRLAALQNEISSAH
ncbi:MAG: alkane 1-monooxygenase [Bdellovibrionales bacterium]